MEITDPRTPGLYYWCPIFGNGDILRPKNLIQPPQLIRLREDGKAECPDATNEQFKSPFFVDDNMWRRMADCPQNARVYAERCCKLTDKPFESVPA
jgi:hypothetical protein